MSKLEKIYRQHKEIILYLLFGVLTTAVNWGIYFPLYNFARLNATLCNVIAWGVSVLFAFLTNKPFVFQSRDWSAKVTVPELLKFVSCRAGSGVLEILLMFLTVDLLYWNGNLMKIAASVFVVVINYIGSKLLFKKS